MSLTMAYCNHGRWVADCPRPLCGNALRLTPRQATFDCNNCGLSAGLEWPPDADELWEVLVRRPVPATRNWFPAGHVLAVRAGIEHGQSVADLVAENHANGVK